LTKKVKTPFHPIAKKFNKDQYFIVIDSMRYNVIYADYDNFYIYFYLESVGEYGY
ncbi:TPA: head-tail adaptor protein, partial [Enterococcus faecium]|nr:head-tail adaptor protein [Enterococcus faecium]